MQSGREAAEIEAVADWLTQQALIGAAMEEIFEGTCERLCAAGLPLWRAHVALPVLHPLFRGAGATWYRGRGAALEHYVSPHMGPEVSDQFQRSPHYAMIRDGVPQLRRRLAGADVTLDYTLLEDLQAAGGTDYSAFLIAYSADMVDGIAGSWATDAAGGFSDRQLQALQHIEQHLALAFKSTIKEVIARNVMTAYLGPDAGARVLSGEIRRGSGEVIEAAIWYCDLRDSTHLAETLTTADFLALLNRYFECTAGAVLAAGGNVLSFIGDAVLAIFPLQGADACARALAAAADAAGRTRDLNAERAETGLAPLAYGLGLHAGRVMYGNIGVPDRLEFTVIGSAINEVARLEDLTKTLHRPVLASGNFVSHHGRPGWIPLGEHQLRGVGAPVEVFAPPPAGS